jgi:hypothetical protein
MKGVLFVILISVSGYWCYDNYGQNIPVHTALTHSDGRSMEVILLSRGKTLVDFERVQDGSHVSFPIRDLSVLSKCKVYWYFREQGQVSSGGTGVVGDGVVGDLHLRGMREDMAVLQEQLRLSQYRFNAAETGAQRRTVQNDIEQIGLKIRKLELKMQEHLSHLH